MSGFTFRPAIRENVGLLLGLMGSSGSGKSFTSMRLAAGMMSVLAPGKAFCVIDTESGRAKHYADMFRFDHGDLTAPFSPARYAEAIAAADAAGYPVIVVDSASHEHAGEGGILDMQEQEFERMGSREAVKMASWIKPKMEHKRMVQRLLQVRAHLILAFRAEQKVDMIRERNDEGRMVTKVVPKQSPVSVDGWIPICEKNLPFELTASFLLTADRPGVPRPIKLQEQHKALFPLDQPITEESGRRLAEWARGGEAKSPGRASVSTTYAVSTGVESDAGQRSQQPAAGPSDRAALIERVNALTAGMAGKERLDLFATFLGERTGAAMGHCKIESLQALVDHLSTQRGAA